MIAALDGPPAAEREAFDRLWIQGLAQAGAAGVLGVAPRTAKRRLGRGVRLLAERPAGLRPPDPA